MKRQVVEYEDDDGRVICNMDVEGMRWHSKHMKHPLFPSTEPSSSSSNYGGDQLSNREARRYTWNAVLAGLLIAAVFSTAWVLFVLFCVKIWFA